MAEPLNEYGRSHWRSAGLTQNYFDRRGVFAAVMWSTPMLVTSAGMLVHMLNSTAALLGAQRAHERTRVWGIGDALCTVLCIGAGGGGMRLCVCICVHARADVRVRRARVCARLCITVSACASFVCAQVREARFRVRAC